MSERAAPLEPGGVIGIIGGGQLGRMTALAAARLGYRCHIYDPAQDSPAAQVAWQSTVGGWDDRAKLDSFAQSVDVVTFEFENIPHDSVQRLAERVPVRPGWNALRISQDRALEKDFVSGLGIPVTSYAAVSDLASLGRALEDLPPPAVLKTRRLGYDGKGQAHIEAVAECEAAWRAIGETPAILEARVDFRMEISVIVARGLDGAMRCYVPVENRHRQHILDTTLAPAKLAAGVAHQAQTITRAIAQGLELVGLLAVEMFVAHDERLLVNEIAPRPHNSGHWTIDACSTSQFEQLVRAVAGLPLGSPERHSDAIMKNLIGKDVERWRELAGDPEAHLHLYGKADVRPGRKMGHVTWLKPKS
jgi:5-(carboxyamino)imidazole ribonucleotide synthase